VNNPRVIIDAGPLVALIRTHDSFHEWASNCVQHLAGPFITSESVISETCFLLHRDGIAVEKLFAFFRRGLIQIKFDLQAEWESVASLMERYARMPKGSMSLADATLVRLSEIDENAAVFTIDRHFRFYRKHGRRQIPLIIPDDVR